MKRVFKRAGRAGGGDRRSSRRTTTRVPAIVTGEDGQSESALVLDVSDGGLQLRIDATGGADAVPTGLLHVAVRSPFGTGEPEFEVRARPAYVRPEHEGGSSVRMGVAFENGRPRMDPRRSGLPLAPDADEQLQRLIEQIKVELPDARQRVIVLTSAQAGEGAQTIARWLALALARDPACRVLYVDADFARPSVNGHTAQTGLLDLLSGVAAAPDVVQSTSVTNLDVVGVGRTSEEALLRFSEAALRRALGELRERYDYVIMGAAAVEASPFSIVLARNADGVFVVVAIGHTSREAVASVIDRVTQYKGRLLGVVVNNDRD